MYDTYTTTWNGQTMTWDNGQTGARSLLGSFTVSSDGHMFNEEDLGWHEIDITEYLRDDCIDNVLSLTLRMMSTQAHDIVIASGVYNDSFTFQDMHNNRFAPVLEIDYTAEEESLIERNTYSPVKDAYISQNGSDRSANFANSEFLGVNYTPDETRSDYWGQESYLSFDLSDIDTVSRQNIYSATLWLYVDETSDPRGSVRTVSVKGNDGNKYNADSMTWGNGTLSGEYELGNFTVEGNEYTIETPGWKQIDVTDFLKATNASNVEFILQMTSDTQHPIKIRSSEHMDIDTRPKLIIDNHPIDISNDYFIETSSKVKTYMYIPKTTDEYIFSSVDGNGLSAVLLDENMQQLSVSTNTNGNFNLRYSLTVGEKYYLKVACDTLYKEYKLYIETPLEVVVL